MTFNNWREDHGMKSRVVYKKKLAFMPVTCHDGVKVWLKPYYAKYLVWGSIENVNSYDDEAYYHTDFIENITEAEYIVRKLSENY